MSTSLVFQIKQVNLANRPSCWKGGKEEEIGVEKIIKVSSSKLGQSISGFLGGFCKIPRMHLFWLLENRKIFQLQNGKWSKISSLKQIIEV